MLPVNPHEVVSHLCNDLCKRRSGDAKVVTKERRDSAFVSIEESLTSLSLTLV
jgi:hypothetical protein